MGEPGRGDRAGWPAPRPRQPRDQRLGATFSLVGRPSGPGLFFLDENRGWFATETGTWVTQNGGTLWRDPGLNPDARLTRTHFGDAQFGWGIGPAVGLAYFSPDGGTTWVPQGVPVTTPLLSLVATDRDHAWIVGAGGVILRYLP
jgi:photosystem II stability/assembly factor-like uncharacterized protein